eukprot:Polyplicarium_translucidae@DN4112_c0_g1_i1.p1
MKLAEFKTTVDASISSLHYIVANMMIASPAVELHKMPEEMTSVSDAARVTAKGLREIVAKLNEEFTFLDAESGHPQCLQVYGEDGQKRLQLLAGQASDFNQRARTRYEEVTSFVSETAAYFGDAKAKSQPDAHEVFFSTLKEFLGRFGKCVSDYLQNTTKFHAILVESAHNRGLTYTLKGDETVAPKAPGNAALPAARPPGRRLSITPGPAGGTAQAKTGLAALNAKFPKKAPPSMPPLRMSTAEAAREAARIELQGDVDDSTAEEFRQNVRPKGRRGTITGKHDVQENEKLGLPPMPDGFDGVSDSEASDRKLRNYIRPQAPPPLETHSDQDDCISWPPYQRLSTMEMFSRLGHEAVLQAVETFVDH